MYDFSMGQKDGVLVPRQGSTEDHFVNTFHLCKRAKCPIQNSECCGIHLCPSWQKRGPGRTATYGGLAEKTAILGWDAAWPPQDPEQLHNPCHSWQGQVYSKGLDEDSALLHFTSSSFKLNKLLPLLLLCICPQTGF